MKLTESQASVIFARVGRHTGKHLPISALPKPKRLPSDLEELMAYQIRKDIQLGPWRYCTRELVFLPDRKYRLDFAFPQQKIGVEVQGMVHRIKGRFKADIEKRALAMLNGWRILEVSGTEVRNGKAIEWLKTLLEDQK